MRAIRRMTGTALGLALAAVAACSLASVAEASGSAAPRVRPLNPIAVAHFLARQRAGFGSPRQAALLGRRALAQASALPVRQPRPLTSAPPFGSVPTSSALSGLGTTWQPLGPAPVIVSFYGSKNSGRVDAVAVAQSASGDGKVTQGEIFVGTAGGGVWSSNNDGASWVSHTDNAATGLAVGAIAIDPNNSDIIYAGTGEANNCGDCFYGGGVLKSTDGGNTWTVENPSGVFTGADFSAISVDPHNSLHVFAATTLGFFRSTDGGQSWAAPVGTGTFNSPTTGLALDPATNPTTVYMASQDVGIQKSTDGGTNFTPLGGGLPLALDFGVAALGIGTNSAGHPTADQTLYAAIQRRVTLDTSGGDLSIYKSTNGGASWSPLTIPAYTNQSYAYGSGTADQAVYDNAIAVDPANPSHVVAGGIAQVESTDGGSTWSNLNGKSFFATGTNVIHPDTHAFAFAPSGHVIIGCDGGVYEYAGGGPSGMTNLNTNLNTTQAFEDLAVSQTGNLILAGLQDNGTALSSGSLSWPNVTSGDGGYNAINPLDPQQYFFEADQDLFETGHAHPITPPGTKASANFVPPMIIVPNASSTDNPTTYYGAGDLWVTDNPSATIPTWQELTVVGGGVSAIAVAPSNSSVLYVGFDTGQLLVSTNATAAVPTFTDISPGVAQWITHIDVSRTNPGQIALSFSSSNTQFASVPPMVETGNVTLSGTPTVSFTNVTGNLPSGVASNSVVFVGSALIVATDVGVFSTASPSGASTSWSSVGAGLPNVQVLGLTFDGKGDLFAATHGRGIWKLPAPVPAYSSGARVSGTPIAGQVLTAVNGTWTHSPTSFLHHWYLCNSSGGACQAISQATGSSFTLLTSSIGHTLRVSITGVNAAGPGTPVPSAPSGLVQPTAASVKAALTAVLVPSGTGARIGTLLSKEGYGFSFVAPSGGALHVIWTHGTTVIATLVRSFSSRGTYSLKVALTSQGRSLLTHATSLSASATDSFRPQGGAKVSQTATFALRR